MVFLLRQTADRGVMGAVSLSQPWKSVIRFTPSDQDVFFSMATAWKTRHQKTVISTDHVFVQQCAWHQGAVTVTQTVLSAEGSQCEMFKYVINRIKCNTIQLQSHSHPLPRVCASSTVWCVDSTPLLRLILWICSHAGFMSCEQWPHVDLLIET